MFLAMHCINQIPCLLYKILGHFYVKFQILHLDSDLPFWNSLECLAFVSSPSLNSDSWNFLIESDFSEDEITLSTPGPVFKRGC